MFAFNVTFIPTSDRINITVEVWDRDKKSWVTRYSEDLHIDTAELEIGAYLGNLTRQACSQTTATIRRQRKARRQL